MKKFFCFFFLFPCLMYAQHSRQGLTQPDYDTYNLRAWPRQITVVQKYNGGNDNNFQETYLFDSTGHLKEYRKRGFGGERTTRYPLTMSDISQNKQYTFDYDGDLVELRQYDLRKRLISSTHCIYAEGGNLAMSIEYTYHPDSTVVTRRTVSTYDKRERLASIEQYTADELLLWTERRKYDKKGNLKKRTQTFYNDDEVTVTTETRTYTYDRRGNWTHCRYALNGQPMYTIEREIKYYGEL